MVNLIILLKNITLLYAIGALFENCINILVLFNVAVN